MGYDYTDGYSQQNEFTMREHEDYIYRIEDGEGDFEENRKAIVDFLSSCKCGMSLGLALRRYLCKQYSEKLFDEDGSAKGYKFVLSDGTEICVSSYSDDDYDITKDEIDQYAAVFMDVNLKYNRSGDAAGVPKIDRAEARRLLKITGTVRRNKLLKICFALHMDKKDADVFLTKYLSEQTYNYRSADEVIACYCFSVPEANNYYEFLRIKEEFERRAAGNRTAEVKLELAPEEVKLKEDKGYTVYAEAKLSGDIKTEEELYNFLICNMADFDKFSVTTYNEYKKLYEKILKKAKIQIAPNDAHIMPFEKKSGYNYDDYVDDVNRANEMQTIKSVEQLAKRMLEFIPRSTVETVGADGKATSVNDFVSVKNNGENKTNDLPNEIISNLMVSDRINDLLKQKKRIERKDLVFMKFFLLSLEIEEGDEERFSSESHDRFIDECNAMLNRCGFSGLSSFNRYENLILLSLVSSNPFEMFDMIIDSSFHDQ